MVRDVSDVSGMQCRPNRAEQRRVKKSLGAAPAGSRRGALMIVRMGLLTGLVLGLVLTQNLLDMLLFKQFNPGVLGRCLCVRYLR